MQTIAREFNLSETVSSATRRQTEPREIRIFTAQSPRCRSPAIDVGTAVLLGRLDGGTQSRRPRARIGIGPVQLQ